jgi:hypothetical protein
MEKLPFFNAVRVFNNSLVSSALAAAPLADRVFAVCSGILPLADSKYLEIISIEEKQEPFPGRRCEVAKIVNEIYQMNRPVHGVVFDLLLDLLECDHNSSFRLINLPEQLFNKKLCGGFDLPARIVFLQNREDFVRRFQLGL